MRTGGDVVGVVCVAVLGLLSAAGCGGGSTSARGARVAHGDGHGLSAPEPFPTEAAIAALPPPGPVQVDTGVLLGHWEIDPASLAPAPSAVEPLYASLAAERPTAQRATGMECVAREVARFVATANGLPGDVLRRFIVARCGGGAVSATIAVLPVTVSGGSEADVIAHLHDTLAAHAIEAIDPGANRVGLAIFHSDPHVLYVGVASALAQLDVAPAVPVASGGHLQFHARIARAPSELIVMATSGEREVATCTVSGIQPELDVDCPFAAGDARSYVEILGRDGDAVLCMPLALLLGVSGEGAGLVYQVRVPSEPIPMAAGSLGASVLPLLNGERAQIGAPPLALSAEQSSANERVVPYAFSTDPHAMEQALLFAMAGWQLGSGPMLREGRTIQVSAGRATDAGQWLFQALETPLERWVLLDPEARVLALGAASTDGVTIGVASTYRFFDGDADSDRAAAEAALIAARVGTPHGTPGFVDLPALDDAADDIVSGGADPSTALDGALQAAVRSYATARGAVYVTSVLDHIPWSPQVLEASHVAIAVRHAQPEGAAWGVYVVLVVALP